MPQCVFLALAIYLDRQARPVFDAWVAHFNLLIAVALAPAAFVALSLTGPLAWDGLLSFWVRNGAVVVWLTVMTIVLGRNLYRQRRERIRRSGIRPMSAAVAETALPARSLRSSSARSPGTGATIRRSSCGSSGGRWSVLSALRNRVRR